MERNDRDAAALAAFRKVLELDPDNKEVLAWMIKAMHAQGYLVASEAHPPEQVLIFSWGMMEGGKHRPALGFLGGDKLNLMWEQVQYGGFVDPRVLLRGMIRTGVAGKVWDIAESDLFVGAVRSFTLDALDSDAPRAASSDRRASSRRD